MSNWFWSIVIVVALAALGAGYLSSRPASPLPQSERPSTAARSLQERPPDARDIRVDDIFSRDDAVVDRPNLASGQWDPEQLSIVVGPCGQSLALESPFLRFGVPLTFDVDPRAPDAERFARAARIQGARVFLHVDRVPPVAALAALRARFGDFDGIASRTSNGVPEVLAGSGLEFFDERGDADARAFAGRNVGLARRDATADDRDTPGYIEFMLTNAAIRSRREGRLVVLLRPFPASFGALRDFISHHDTEIVALP